MTRYTQSVKRLERADELIETVMGRAFGENAAGVAWMGDVWGLLNQASGKVATAQSMMEAESGWDGMDDERAERMTPSEAMQAHRPPDFAGVPKADAYEIGWLRAIQWMKGQR